MSLARKNGKTALVAGLVLVHLHGPEAVANGEIYSAANDRDQAALIFKVAAQIVRADRELATKLKIVDSTKTIVNYRNGSVYRAISAEAGTKHGLNPTVVIYDELAQAKSRTLYDVLDTSMGARAEPLFISISTQSNDPEHMFSKLVDDGLSANDPKTVCHLYAVPDDEEDLFNEEVWYQANPALGDFRDLEDFRALAEKAKRMPSELAKFRNLFLNQRVSPITGLIHEPDWKACAGEARFTDGEPVYLGLDLSSVNDLTALVMVSAGEKSKVKAWFWKPQDTLREQSNRDFGHGNWLYEQWAKDGWIEGTPGRVIDHAYVAKTLIEITKKYKVLGMAYDRHKIENVIKELDKADLQSFEDGKKGDGLRIVPFGQGVVSMSPAIDYFEKAVISGEIVHPSNPVLNWNVTNAVAVMDPAGNRKLDKAKARFRIDGAVAMVMALGLKARDRQGPEPKYQALFF